MSFAICRSNLGDISRQGEMEQSLLDHLRGEIVYVNLFDAPQ